MSRHAKEKLLDSADESISCDRRQTTLWSQRIAFKRSYGYDNNKTVFGNSYGITRVVNLQGKEHCLQIILLYDCSCGNFYGGVCVKLNIKEEADAKHRLLFTPISSWSSPKVESYLLYFGPCTSYVNFIPSETKPTDKNNPLYNVCIKQKNKQLLKRKD